MVGCATQHMTVTSYARGPRRWCAVRDLDTCSACLPRRRCGRAHVKENTVDGSLTVRNGGRAPANPTCGACPQYDGSAGPVAREVRRGGRRRTSKPASDRRRAGCRRHPLRRRAGTRDGAARRPELFVGTFAKSADLCSAAAWSLRCPAVRTIVRTPGEELPRQLDHSRSREEPAVSDEDTR